MNMLAELTEERGPSLATVIGACIETRRALMSEHSNLFYAKEQTPSGKLRMIEIQKIVDEINENLQWLRKEAA